MGTYAAHTKVSAEDSLAEINSIVTRYGATHFGYTTAPEGARLGFAIGGRAVRFDLPMPTKDSFRRVFIERHGRQVPQDLSDEQMKSRWEQACRQRWRALALVVKAKLEAVESGVVTFEQEFLAHLVLPTGETVGDRVWSILLGRYVVVERIFSTSLRVREDGAAKTWTVPARACQRLKHDDLVASVNRSDEGRAP